MINRQFLSCRGFSLLEVLVAVLILAVGLLGVAGMQIKALKSSHLSYQRSIANLAAQDMVERLWVEMANSNRLCVDPGDSSDTNSVFYIWASEWEEKLSNLSSESSVSRAECEYSITVAWTDERFLASSGGVEDVSSLSYVISIPGRW